MVHRQSVVRRCVSVVVLVTLTIQTAACTTGKIEEVRPLVGATFPRARIVSVTTQEGEVVRFDERFAGRQVEATNDLGYRVVPPSAHNDSIYGRVDGSPYTVAFADVTSVSVDGRHVSADKTRKLVTGIVVGAAALVGLIVLVVECSRIDNDGPFFSC